MITLTHYLVLSGILFSIGLVGVMKRKNILMLFFSTEILLNAVNIGFVAVSKYYGDLSGQMFAFFIDGTHTAISHFDLLKNDVGYASSLENSVDEMASSHQVKSYQFWVQSKFDRCVSHRHLDELHRDNSALGIVR